MLGANFPNNIFGLNAAPYAVDSGMKHQIPNPRIDGVGGLSRSLCGSLVVLVFRCIRLTGASGKIYWFGHKYFFLL